ncbi:Fe-S-cluster containining protein [Tangfeifania diversioriginum]|uniref:Fe-S-cluster containining protein n=1 Tax=Tangfeifania diversioriginum TaxID=1168035 RepID=A0A1M6K6M6_9BACT|nr:YkgJ family cysteine cluster protein [Tangfeifania diversioriginum]SHJ54611.1 Fe-S-cluster containining protein [Tangfeifania diversioriginum]
MDDRSKIFYKKYYNQRKEIDSATAKLTKKHHHHMECKSGCDSCCMDYGILPVEFFSIVEELRANNFDKAELPPQRENNDSCVFLQKHVCTIYQSRPVICRTHGLPLLFTNDEGEWQLSACELNFTQFNFENFTTENTYSQDKYNSELFLLNREFIAEFKNGKYNQFDLIPLKKLKNYL